jgi:hypothetical protein
MHSPAGIIKFHHFQRRAEPPGEKNSVLIFPSLCFARRFLFASECAALLSFATCPFFSLSSAMLHGFKKIDRSSLYSYFVADNT